MSIFEINSNHPEEDAAESVLNSVMDPEVVQSVQDEAAFQTLVIKRMQHANLYRVLLEQSFFEPGSAAEEIQETVEKEIRDFIAGKLADLLGMRSPEKVEKVEVQPPFDENELRFLKMLAGRGLNKVTAPSKEEPLPTPTLKRVAATAVTAPVVKKAPVTKAPPKVPQDPLALDQAATRARIQELAKKRRDEEAAAAAAQAAAPQAPKKAKGNRPKPMKMPSVEEQIAKYSTELSQMSGSLASLSDYHNNNGVQIKEKN